MLRPQPTLVGWGLVVNASASWLSWQAYLLGPLGGREGDWAGDNIGILLAMVVGFIGYWATSAGRVREQEKLARLSLEMYRHRVPLIVAYEGWDAAGKGGNIKRLTAAMDARGYRVNPIGPASRDELARPFLWRFWNRLPRSGHTAIFDRTWYGRVLVERIEGFATKDEWRRAYDEINEFEDDLRIWGAVLVKFWIDVSPAEQLARFESRQADPARRWKITPDDWRNRAKNDLYYECVDDMVRLTSTPYAPWHIIQSDDKRYARVKALKIVNKALSERLEL